MNTVTLTETNTIGRDSQTLTVTYEFDEHPDFTVMQLMPAIVNGCKLMEGDDD